MVRRYNQVTADAGMVQREAARPASISSDVVVPALQSVITGAIGGAVWAGSAAALGGDPWPILAACSAIFGGACWLVLLSDHRRALWAWELREDRDIDGDGSIGRPVAPTLLNPYQGRAARGRDSREADFNRWADFVRGCESDTSARTWEARIGREQYRLWRDSLIDSGWATWRQPGNERAGWELTADAQEVIDAIVWPVE